MTNKEMQIAALKVILARLESADVDDYCHLCIQLFDAKLSAEDREELKAEVSWHIDYHTTVETYLHSQELDNDPRPARQKRIEIVKAMIARREP